MEQASRKRTMYARTEVESGRGEAVTPMRKLLLPLYHQIAAGTNTLEVAAAAAQVSVARVTKDYREWRKAVEEFAKVGDWEMDPTTAWELALDLEMPAKEDAEACARWAIEATERFMAFERRWFATSDGKPFMREDFHYEWITATLATIASGGYLQILSPPRHGKSELLVHFCVWLICRNPNIRILWVGPNDDIAGDMLVAVKTYLADTTEMIEAVLGPGRSFEPTSLRGSDWSSKSFTVAARTVTLVGSTMLATGRGGQLLSRNADLIVCDDIENKASVAQPKLRQSTKDWFGTDLDSRKEEHTGLVVIGSRQHLDDIYNSNLKDPNFYNIVNSAHDPDCPLDPYNEKLHKACMLFPALRTYRWLMTKKRGAEARNNAKLFEMVYQNNPLGEGMAVFNKKAIMAARNPSRAIGLSGIPSGFSLVAGLDPSSTGYQAAFLWALRMRKDESITDRRTVIRVQRWMVDLDNSLGGGIQKANDLMKKWLDLYGCRHWVVEVNAFQQAILDDEDLVRWAKQEDVTLTPHRTGINKVDPVYGVGSMNRLYEANLIDLPYGDEEAVAKVDMYVEQMLAFTEEATSHNRAVKSDILMASWFPTYEIRKMERRLQKEHMPPQHKARDNYQKSYPKVSRLTGRSVPWRG